jgi:hypothetical protein
MCLLGRVVTPTATATRGASGRTDRNPTRENTKNIGLMFSMLHLLHVNGLKFTFGAVDVRIVRLGERYSLLGR